ncbi:hypothetical protein H3H39_23965 [Duganella sp. LX47W]|uniref:Transmembrane protein n=1 Tax=Rugamonas apoptosis TaxID=2758570 RepID=A0A7W2IMW4_9BURK|nr:hypothetical protein [Rugamonas apoptosis]
MNGVQLSAFALRARLALARVGAPACVAVLLCAAGAAGWAWLLSQRAAQVALSAQPLSTSTPETLVSAPPPPTADQNLAAFYDVLGEQRYAEQQVKLLFRLAAKANLTLSQGEYKSAYDKASRVSTYQIVLPVKGPYAAVWQFTLQALRAMPFAALDEVSFRRDAITDPAVEARIRLTLYLKDAQTVVQP